MACCTGGGGGGGGGGVGSENTPPGKYLSIRANNGRHYVGVGQ